MSYKFSPDHLLMHKLWRKALREGGLQIELATVADATRLRFSLYNSVKPIRQGKAFDEELELAVQECTISLSGVTVSLNPKSSSPMMQAVMQALGDDVAELGHTPMTAEEVEIQASAQRLLDQLGSGVGEDGKPVSPDTRVTPYYTRKA